MRAIALSMAGFLVAGAMLPALAQESRIDQDRLPVRNSSQTEEALPEWYQRFTFRDGEDGRTAWTGTSERDVAVSLVEGSRWKLRLGLKTREGETGLPREEMSAGATYNITPRFSVGGALSLGAEDLTPNGEWSAQELETGIRLQSAFKF